jgi:hypothetical protein
MARLRDEVDMVPCMGFDFNGPEHEAEIFVKLQRYRKPLVTKDMHGAELFAGGEFGRVAQVAQAFVDGLHCETVPLASIRKLARVKPEALERVKPLLDPLVGPTALHKDFIEALSIWRIALNPVRAWLLDIAVACSIWAIIVWWPVCWNTSVGTSPIVSAKLRRHV